MAVRDHRRKKVGTITPCALEGCEGTFVLGKETQNSKRKQKFCCNGCTKREFRLRGRKTIVVRCRNEECNKQFPTIHPDERRQKRDTMHYDYCCLDCARADEVGVPSETNEELIEATRKIRVVSFASVLNTGVPLTAKALSKACDMFTDDESELSKEPPSKRFKRDTDEFPYLKAIDLSQHSASMGADTCRDRVRIKGEKPATYSWGRNING